MQPKGCPRAIAPPLTLTLSVSSSSSADDSQGLRGEGFVQFYQIDIFQGKARNLQCLGDRSNRTDTHQLGRDAAAAKDTKRARA